ncbi:cation transporter [Marinicella litoralis]|uniref:Mercuric ion binding protein n=1 Tax=Marinicella litoralis TaxID=644220 RepID=A0A4R6XK76_9GAMM|nr:cation transporter [Marinicella litoralis]TDR18284.1 mercuric ion binding protein [Marinicella litoralis]
MNKQKVFTVMVLIYILITSTGAMAANQVVALTIDNMTCKMCDITVRKAIENVDGVIDATVDFESKSALVNFDPDKTSIDLIVKAATLSGYPAQIKPE